MCVLRVYGPDFDPEAYLASGSGLEPLAVYVPGNPTYDRRLAKHGTTDQGFHVGVSDRDWSDWKGQVEDATAFLREHEAELRALADRSDVTSIHLDFPTEVDPEERNVIIWGGGFPVGFLEAAARAGVEAYITLYFATDEEEDDGEVSGGCDE